MKRKPAKDFQELIVWQKAHQFVLLVYKVCKFFPKNELYGLTSQIRRAAISIPANITEGFKKKNKTGKSKILKYCASFSRRMQILFNISQRPRLWRYHNFDEST